MKKIEAIVREGRLSEVIGALEQAGYPGITVTEVEGHGKQRGLTQVWRGQEYKVDLIPKMKVEIVVSDKMVDKLVEALMKSARTGAVGDGKIFVSDVSNAVRIRTGEKGEEAVS